jgi:DNA-binding CsgD family transcriptional regulator
VCPETGYRLGNASRITDPKELSVTITHESEADRLLVCDQAGSVYLYALRAGAIRVCPEVADELGVALHVLDELTARLRDLRLLRPDPVRAHRFVPVDPDIAAAALISPLEGEIHSRRELITSIRAQLSGLFPMYAQAQPRRETTTAVRPLRDRAELCGSLYLAVNGCREEILSVRPRATMWEDSLDEALARDVAALRRGVRLRVLYHHSARTDRAVWAYARRIAAEGGQVRTANHLPRPFVVVDGGIAFTSDATGALEMSDPALAQLLCEVFDCVWDPAQPYRTDGTGGEDVTDDILRDIARLLAEGLTDEVIARRLGMSARTCRRHIARLLQTLGSVSRFQAGTRAASVGIVGA